MSKNGKIDCVTIGYYEPRFDDYENEIRQWGVDSEAYRDLQFSFVDLSDKKLTYAELLSYVYRLANDGEIPDAVDAFKSGDIPSLAAAYLTNFLRRRGLSSTYVNLFLYEKVRLNELLDRDPLSVAITTTFFNLNSPVIYMIEEIRRRNPRTKIIVGGPLVANHNRRFPKGELLIALDDMDADVFVIESQGEQTLYRIVECLKNGGDLATVPNIVYRDEKRELRVTEPEPEANSLDENYIDWKLFNDVDLGATLQTRTARSCAFSCAFCAYPTRAGKLTLASVETIEKELDTIREVGGVKNVVFIDDTFNVPLPRFKDICRLIIRKNYEFNWFSYFRCSNSDEEAIELMARSGCKGVFLGVESGSPTVLVNMAKHATIEKYTKGIKLLREHGILTFGSFITGFPGETAETVRETVDFIKDSKLDYYRSQIWYCEAGTPIYFEKDKYGIDGEGFVWSHSTMDSMEAMDHVDKMFLSIKESKWLPQWSFDFWIIPYLLGKGMSLDMFERFITRSNELLALEIASVAEADKRRVQQQTLSSMIADMKGWQPIG